MSQNSSASSDAPRSGHYVSSAAVRNHKVWRPYEHEQLVRLHEEGKTGHEIAYALRRSVPGVYNRLGLLRQSGEYDRILEDATAPSQPPPGPQEEEEPMEKEQLESIHPQPEDFQPETDYTPTPWTQAHKSLLYSRPPQEIANFPDLLAFARIAASNGHPVYVMALGVTLVYNASSDAPPKGAHGDAKEE